MLVVTSEQLHSLGALGLERFKEGVVTHLAEYFPMRLELSGETGLWSLASEGVQRAAAYGLTSEAAMRSFCEALAGGGIGVDEDPMFADICDPLFDRAVGDDIARADAVHGALWDFVEQAYGEDAECLMHAAGRMRAWLRPSCPVVHASEQAVLAHLEEIFPEKFAAVEEAAATVFYRQCVKHAARDGFRQPGAICIYVTAAFVVGFGFYRDPIFSVPAAAQLAALDGITDHAERTRLLRQAVNAFSDKLLATAYAECVAA